MANYSLNVTHLGNLNVLGLQGKCQVNVFELRPYLISKAIFSIFHCSTGVISLAFLNMMAKNRVL